jgi:hypothetical protein
MILPEEKTTPVAAGVAYCNIAAVARRIDTPRREW